MVKQWPFNPLVASPPPRRSGQTFGDSIHAHFPIDGGMKQESTTYVPKKHESDPARGGAGSRRRRAQSPRSRPITLSKIFIESP